MRHIYARASKTLLWLGKASVDSTLGLQTLQEFSKKYKEVLNNNISDGHTTIARRPRRWAIQRFWDRVITVWDPKWGAYFRLLDRPYFTRAWIVQEVVVSKNSYVICGEKAIPWYEFFCAFAHCVTYESWLFEFHGSWNLHNLIALQLSQLELHQKKEQVYYGVMLRHRTSISTDARDKVFAYHGISAHSSFTRRGIRPDYTRSTGEVFLDVARKSLENATTLELLDIPRVTADNHGLPTWGELHPISLTIHPP